MVRRIGLFLFAIGVTLSMATVSAHAQTALTSHVHDAVLNGRAKLIGSLPANQVIEPGHRVASS